MKCKVCGNTNIETAETKQYSDYCRRRRKCIKCGALFTTYEMPMTPKEFRKLNGGNE